MQGLLEGKVAVITGAGSGVGRAAVKLWTEHGAKVIAVDIDLPSGDRREQVIQEVYRRYGPHGAAMTATVHTYRGRGIARINGPALRRRRGGAWSAGREQGQEENRSTAHGRVSYRSNIRRTSSGIAPVSSQRSNDIGTKPAAVNSRRN